ncbi:hypothetical protein BDZ91DRAFT_751684 [Kalaharituber pfeilii]|nr:hypothetical protein BDZ91DRAFT_751684 [Kalaharituber pfeilii]
MMRMTMGIIGMRLKKRWRQIRKWDSVFLSLFAFFLCDILLGVGVFYGLLFLLLGSGIHYWGGVGYIPAGRLEKVKGRRALVWDPFFFSFSFSFMVLLWLPYVFVLRGYEFYEEAESVAVDWGNQGD